MTTLRDALVEAIVSVEESRLDPFCMADECQHGDDCPDVPGLGCGDTDAILAHPAMQAIAEKVALAEKVERDGWWRHGDEHDDPGGSCAECDRLDQRDD